MAYIKKPLFLKKHLYCNDIQSLGHVKQVNFVGFRKTGAESLRYLHAFVSIISVFLDTK